MEHLYINHWPPTLHDISDAFARIEALCERVTEIHLHGEDLKEMLKSPDFVNYHSIEDGEHYLWGAELICDSPTSILTFSGENGTKVTMFRNTH